MRDERRDELFHARTPLRPPLTYRKRNRIIRRMFSPPVLSSIFFVFLYSFLVRACGPLLIPRSSFRLSLLSCMRASARNLPRDHFRVDTDSQPGYSPATLFFLTFPCARRRRRENVVPASLPARFLHTTTECAITENLLRKTRQLRVINDEV